MLQLVLLPALLFAGVSAVFLDRSYGPQPQFEFSCRAAGDMTVRAYFDFGEGWDEDFVSRALVSESADLRPYRLALPRFMPRKMKINFDAIDGVFELQDFQVDLDRSGRVVDSGFTFKPVSATSGYRVEEDKVVGQTTRDQKLPSLRVYLEAAESAWPRTGGTALFWKRYALSFLFAVLILMAVLSPSALRGRRFEE